MFEIPRTCFKVFLSTCFCQCWHFWLVTRVPYLFASIVDVHSYMAAFAVSSYAICCCRLVSDLCGSLCSKQLCQFLLPGRSQALQPTAGRDLRVYPRRQGLEIRRWTGLYVWLLYTLPELVNVTCSLGCMTLMMIMLSVCGLLWTSMLLWFVG